MPGDLLVPPKDRLAAVAEILKKTLENFKANQLSVRLLDDRSRRELGPKVFFEILPAVLTVLRRLDDLQPLEAPKISNQVWEDSLFHVDAKTVPIRKGLSRIFQTFSGRGHA